MSTDYCLCLFPVGGEFLLGRVKVAGQERCYFATAEDGQPSKLQRKPFSECFYTVAMSELHRATGDQRYQVKRSYTPYNTWASAAMLYYGLAGRSREHAQPANLLDKGG